MMNIDNLNNYTEILSSVKNNKKILEKINWNSKSKRMWEMYKSREYLFDGIYLTTYGNRTILISQLCGGVFRFKNNIDRLIIEGKKMKLQKIRRPFEERTVYENGKFYPTLRKWLMESCQLTGGNGVGGAEYKCFTLEENEGFEKIIIRDHQMQVLMKYGLFSLTAIGNEAEKRENCVNHKNGDKRDNRICNLEIISNKNNSKHYNEELREFDLLILVDEEPVFNPRFNV